MRGVVVVGGGPVGMLMAAELAIRGVATTVVESRSATHDEPRAGTLHARTVQSLTRRGYLSAPDAATARSRRTVTVPFHFAGRPILTLESPAAEGPPMVGRSQADLERFFEARARAAGAVVRRGETVVDVRSGPDRVEVELDGGEVLVGAYAVGCDGARSTVRERLGFTSTTTPPTFAGILGLVRLDNPAVVPSGWAHGPVGSTLANVSPLGLSRIVAHEFGDLPDRGSPVTLDELRGVTSRVLQRDVRMSRPAYLGRFSDFTRLADTYRIGRVLLAGDAAHVHAPLGGQGLNTGLQDAINLGWKLAMVVAGRAPERLLDTYDSERRPVAAAVIANTRVQGALMRPDAEPVRGFVAGLMSLPDNNSGISDLISGQGVRYTDGPGLTGAFLPNAPIGESSVVELLVPGEPVLLLSGDVLEAAPWADRVRMVTVDGSPFADPAILLRPDGYVAWSGATGVSAALTSWFGEPGAALGHTGRTGRAELCGGRACGS
ncbi:2-polyprenyl-6-methoxyphenol hydroxylase-like FAD-dependent oxidoreductase [Actinokineospora baliensis]|uniref:FAD-dependent monooxygenase n=1 Tax=Actinokineospora baliensis TaxID=547056 RepID=UPI0019587A50|nr:FAD-dependent monooxygenase [Actinokineospora baliensis]MBM7775021.1 2-polyprenyl-6-methoxyphenol hydroxylase-like FAD-dependent oxidoreductase [Actinokineospora baliensis]